MQLEAQEQTIANRYTIQTLIGQGGMGKVYQGVDTRNGSLIATKSLRVDIIDSDPNVIERFRREADALRQLNHPNIVKVLDTVEEGQQKYIIMEYMAGGSLEDLLKKDPILPLDRVLSIALDLSDALTRAHRLQIVHRDLKPANVLIADDGTPRLTDFGVARMGNQKRVTDTGVAVGTLDYLPPEALNGEAVDERADIWSFGVMLYQLLAGERPFHGGNIGQTLSAILTKPIPDIQELRSDLPVALVDLVCRMLDKNVETRISSVRLVGAELEAIMRGDESSIFTVTPVTPMKPIVVSSGRRTTNHTTVLGIKNNLPNLSTPFVGRKRELKDIKQLLDDPNVRLVTILAPGGMGKTRVSVEVARLCMKRYDDGVFFVPLAPLESSDFIIATIAENIDFGFGQGDPKDELLNYLAEKKMLIILHNFEHLMDGVAIVTDLLRFAPNLEIIVTSRERLRLRDEYIYDLQGMLIPPVKNKEDLLDFPAVTLFEQSVHRIQPEFEATIENVDAIAKICALVQGLPLGIELASGWLETLSIEEIVQEIEQSIDFLETDLRDIPERHRSIRAVFEYSWDLMSEDDRAVFMKISVFRGGFMRDAAQKVAGASLRNLTNLVNKSLLRRTAEGRYMVHELLRQYAEEYFQDSGDYKTVVMQHAMYYVEFLKKMESRFNTDGERLTVLAIEMELENLRVAWLRGIKGKHWEALDEVIQVLSLFYQARGMIMEGAEIFRDLADALQADGKTDSKIYWKARGRQAWLAGRLGYFEESFPISKDAYEFFQKENDLIEQVWALNSLSLISMGRGDYEESVDFAQTGAEISKNIPDDIVPWVLSASNLGYAEFLRGNYEIARNLYEEILEKAHVRGLETFGLAYSLNNLGEILKEMGELERALNLFTQSHEIFKALQHRRGMAFTLNNIGGICFVGGNFDHAKEAYQQAYGLNKELGDFRGLGHSLSALGNIAVFAGDQESAKQYFEESLTIRRKIGDRRGIADSLSDLARIYAYQGQLEDAEKVFMESVQLREKIGDRQGKAMSLAGAGIVMIFNDRLEQAEEFLREAREIGEQLGNKFTLTQTYSGLGELALRYKNFDDAETYFKQALKLTDKMNLQIMMFAVAGYAEVEFHKGHYEHAVALANFAGQYHASTMEMSVLDITHDKGKYVLELVKQSVSVAEYETAIQNYANMTLEQVIAEILAEKANIKPIVT